MVRALSRHGFSNKKKTVRAQEQSREDVVAKTEQFLDELSKIPTEKLIFQDESGFQETLRRKNAWSQVGTPAICQHSAQPARDISVIGAVRLSGPVVMKSYEGGTDKQRFISWFKNSLLPRLNSGDRVVLDNLRVHHAVDIKALAVKAKIRLLYNPPYSPQYNPIELMSAIRKQRIGALFSRATDSFRHVISGAWRAIKSINFSGLFDACIPIGSTQSI